VGIDLRLDEVGELRGLSAEGESVRLERVGEDSWFLRVGDTKRESLTVTLQTITNSPRIEASFVKRTPRK
jgi:hypothetical protein